MHYTGYYINLDGNRGRKQELERQLAACNLQPIYKRHPASLGNALNLKAPGLKPGAVGCFTSHYLLLQSLKNAATHVHVAEDDIVFGPTTGLVIDSMARNGDLDKWDMIYTDVWVPPDLQYIRELSALYRQCATLNPDGTLKKVERFTLLNLSRRVFASTVSYVVNKNSLNKIAAILAEAVQGELSMPIDLYYRHQIHQGRISAACIFPFVTSVNIRENLISNITDTADGKLQRSILSTTMLRNLFFLHCDPKSLLKLGAEYLQVDAVDARDQVIGDILRFSVSPSAQAF
jgi:GR25 family glycosyltransferase involved in LPS biosynthesis